MNLKNIKKTLFLIVLSLAITACGGSSTDNQEADSPSEKQVQKDSNWHNKKFSKQTGKTTATFTAKPSEDNIDSVIGFSNGDANKYTDLGIIVRFSTSGYIDARDGSTYKQNNNLKYSKNKTYSFKVEMDFFKHTYSVFVKVDNEAEVKVANNFKFRSEQSNLNSIDNVAHYTQGDNTIYVNNISFSNENTEEDNKWQNSLEGMDERDILNFDATPSATNIDSVIGLSTDEANKYTDLAMIVRFAPDGYIDARDGGEYRRINNIKYSANTTYTFRIDADFEHHTYDIYVTPNGGEEVQIGNDFSFRLEQNSISSTNYIANYTLGSGEVTIANVTQPNANAHTWNNYNISDAEYSNNTKIYTVSFTASASATNIDGVMGLSNGNAEKYSDLAMIVRFAPDGYIDARDGGEYRRTNSIKYSTNQNYHFIFDINFTSHTYSIHVANEDDSNIVKIGNNFKFRLEQSELNSVDTFSTYTKDSEVINANIASTWINNTPYTKFPKLDFDYTEVEYRFNNYDYSHKLIVRDISNINNPTILKIIDLPRDPAIGDYNYVKDVGVSKNNKTFYFTHINYRSEGSSYYKMIIGQIKDKNTINFYSTYIDDLSIYSKRTVARYPEFTLDSSKLIRYTDGWISNHYDEILYDQYSDLYNDDYSFYIPTEIIISTLSDTEVTNTKRSFYDASTIHTYYNIPQPKLFKKEVNSQRKLLVKVIDITKDKNNQQALGNITLEESEADYSIDILAHNTTNDELFIRLEPKDRDLNDVIYKIYNIADIAQPLLIESTTLKVDTVETVKK